MKASQTVSSVSKLSHDHLTPVNEGDNAKINTRTNNAMTQDQPQPPEPYSKLTHRQYRAIECLASSVTVADAAKSAGVGRATLYRWLKDPVFKAACEQRRAETLSYTKQRIKELYIETLDNLDDFHGFTPILKSVCRLARSSWNTMRGSPRRRRLMPSQNPI